MAVTVTGPAASAGSASTEGAAWIIAYWRPFATAALVIGIAAALGIATYRSGWLPQRARDVADQIAHKLGEGANSVAGLFNLRSPGERASGALASLKMKLPPLHQRALPKVRRPRPPMAGVAAAPPVPPGASVPLYNLVAPPKPATPVLPVALTPSGGVPGGIFPAITPLPGGGIIVPPPSTTQPPPPDVPVVVPVTPGAPGTPAVPEPATWVMMLLGFAMIGCACRRRQPILSSVS